MKRLIISALMLMVATFIFSQGNNGDNDEQSANQELVKNEQVASKVNKL